MCFRPVTVKKRENICPNCKKVNEPTATICAYCGAKLIALPGRPGGPPPATGAPPKPPIPPTPPKKPEEQ